MKASPIPGSMVMGIFVGLLVAGSACAVEIITAEDISQGTISEQDLVKVADNAVFLLDASSSMNSKFEQEILRFAQDDMLEKSGLEEILFLRQGDRPGLRCPVHGQEAQHGKKADNAGYIPEQGGVMVILSLPAR